MNDLRNFLHGLPAFARFSERQLDALLGNLRLEDFPAGRELVTQDAQGPALYIIVSGTVQVTRVNAAGELEQEPREARDGEVVGLLSLVDDMPSPETCTARSAVTAAVLTCDRFNALFLMAPAVAHQLQYMVAVQLARDLQEKNRSLRQGLARQRPGSLLERFFGR